MRHPTRLLMVLGIGLVLAACGGTPGGAGGDGGNGDGDGNGPGTDAAAQPQASLVALHGGSIGLMPFVEIGSCFWVLASAPDLTNVVEIVSCDNEHQYEMFAKVEVPGDDWPGEERLNELATDCEEGLFEDYVGTPSDESTWEILAVAPTEAEWAAGQRTIQCAVFDPNEESTEGSVQDSGE